MANTLIEQTALDIVFGGATDTVDYQSVIDALERGVQPLDAVPDTVYIWEHFQNLDADGVAEVLESFVSTLTTFAGDVLASV
jgi:formaldehyde-activating enzyme involved in methanogenesis